MENPNQTETEKLINELNAKTARLEDKLDQSLQQMNVAITSLVNSQIQINNKLENISDKLEIQSNKIKTLSGKRWLYRILLFIFLGGIALGGGYVFSNWDSLVNSKKADNRITAESLAKRYGVKTSEISSTQSTKKTVTIQDIEKMLEVSNRNVTQYAKDYGARIQRAMQGKSPEEQFKIYNIEASNVIAGMRRDGYLPSQIEVVRKGLQAYNPLLK